MFKRRKKPVNVNLRLKSSDVEAIACTLPLLDYIEADTPEQQDRNFICANSALEKLLARSGPLDANETRVIAASLTLAKLFLAGKMPELGPYIDPEHLADLKKYFFNINRLEADFNKAIEPLL